MSSRPFLAVFLALILVVELLPPAAAVTTPIAVRSNALPLPFPLGNSDRPLSSIAETHNKTVVFIEDVHGNLDAQNNIATTLDFLFSSYGIKLVGLEGAFGAIDLAPFRAFPNHDALRSATEHFVAEKKMSGALKMGLLSPETPALFGVDDQKHYRRNAMAVRLGSAFRPRALTILANYGGQLDEAKTQLLNARLREFDFKVQRYYARDISLKDYLQFLSSQPGAQDVPHGNMTLFSTLLDLEKSLNFHLVDAERGALFNRLDKRLQQDHRAEFLTLLRAFAEKKSTPPDFYERITALCADAGLDLKAFPNFHSYLAYVKLSEKLDQEQLLEEMSRIEANSYRQLIRTHAERKLIECTRALRLMEKLVRYSLSASEWSDYARLMADVRPWLFDDTLGFSLKLTNEQLKIYEAFYLEARQRDHFMAVNLVAEMQRTNLNRAVLVAGGFHRSGIKSALEALGISVLTVRPYIKTLKENDNLAYLDSFCEQKTPLERLFPGTQLFLVLPQLSDVQRRNLTFNLLAEWVRRVPSLSRQMLTRWFLRLSPTSVPVVVEGRRDGGKDVLVVVPSNGQPALALVYDGTSSSYLRGPQQVPVLTLVYPMLNSKHVYPVVERYFGDNTNAVIRWVSLTWMVGEITVLGYFFNGPIVAVIMGMLLVVFAQMLFEAYPDMHAIPSPMSWQQSFALRLSIVVGYCVGLFSFNAPLFVRCSLFVVAAVSHAVIEINLLFGWGLGKRIAVRAPVVWKKAVIVMAPLTRRAFDVFHFFAGWIFPVHIHIAIARRLYSFMRVSLPPVNPEQPDTKSVAAARLLNYRLDFFNFITRAIDPYNNARQRFMVVVRRWPLLSLLMQGKRVVSGKPDGVFEMHPAEPCSDNCKFCRGGLRAVTGNSSLSLDHMINAIDDVFRLNPDIQFKISGIIGEPLVNPFTRAALMHLNEKEANGIKASWVFVTNGKHFNDEAKLKPGELGIKQILVNGAESVNISVDAGSEWIYSGVGPNTDFSLTVLDFDCHKDAVHPEQNEVGLKDELQQGRAVDRAILDITGKIPENANAALVAAWYFHSYIFAILKDYIDQHKRQRFYFKGSNGFNFAWVAEQWLYCAGQ